MLKKNITFIALVFLGFLPGAEVDICISVFPFLMEKFKLSAFQVEYLLTLNLIFHLISAIFVGLIGDIYGRKKSTIFGLIIFIIGAIISCISNFHFILFGRILQGIGSAFPMINTSLLILNIYKEKTKQTEILMMISGVSIIGIAIAPVIGAKMTQYFGWNGSFIFLFSFAVLTMFMTMNFIHENRIDHQSMAIGDILNFKKIHIFSKIQHKLKHNFSFLSDKKIILFIVYLTLAASSYYTYLSMSSILYIEVFGVSLANFSYFQGTTALVFGTVSFLSGRIIAKFSLKRIFKISIFLWCIFVVLEVIALAKNLKNPYLFCGMMLCSSMGASVPINFIYSKLFRDVNEQYRGKLSSISMIARWTSVSFFVQMASFFYKKTIFSTIFINCSLTFISLLILLFMFRKYKDVRENFGFSD